MTGMQRIGCRWLRRVLGLAAAALCVTVFISAGPIVTAPTTKPTTRPVAVKPTTHPVVARPTTNAAVTTAPTTKPAVVVVPATKPAVAVAPTTLPAEISAKVEALVKKLSDEAWQTRQKAQDELVQMGPMVQPRLQELLKQTRDEEVRSRVEAALVTMEENRLTGTSFITIHLKKASPKQIFAELARQANAEMRPNPPNLWDAKSWPLVDIDIERQPFWVAMREICGKIGVSPQSNGMDRSMVIMDRNAAGRMWGEAPVVVSGPFLVVATYINRSNYVDLNQPQNIGRQCNVQLMVYFEPKMRVLQASYSAKIDEAIDDKGNSLVMSRSFVEGMQPVSGWVWNMSASLLPNPNTGDKIAKLKGSGRFLIQTRSEVAEVPDVVNAHEVSREIGGRRFKLKEVRKSGDAYVAHLTIFRAGWNPNEWNTGVPHNTFRMVDARGVALTRINSGNNVGGEQMDITLQFQRQNWNGGENAGEPTKLICEVPVETREIVVPFEFKNLPLP